MCLNFGIAEENEHASVYLRFEDTNPIKESVEFVEAIKTDVRWLGFDWEDIAVGPGPEPGVSYVYIGDIGDNLRLRSTISLLRFPEPDLDNPPEAITVVERITSRQLGPVGREIVQIGATLPEHRSA